MGGMGPDTDYAVVARNLAVVGFGLGGALSAFAIATQWVDRIEAPREVFAGLVGVSRHDRNRPFSRPRNSSAVPHNRRSRAGSERSGIKSMSRPGTASPSGKG